MANALAAIHVAKKQLGLDEDTYRAVLVRATGKDSTKAMTERERSSVVEEFRKRGFKPASKGSRKRLEGQYAAKLQALWIAGWNLGVFRNRDDAALIKFVQRQAKVDHVRFLHHHDDAAKAIEALKAWMAREAGVDWSLDKLANPVTQDDRFRVAWAQFRKIIPGATWMGNGRAFLTRIEQLTGHPVAALSDLHPTLNEHREVVADGLSTAGWQKVMNAFGEHIRAAKAEQDGAGR